MKKRAFSLIEVIICLGLLSLLLSTLFYWYYSVSKQKEDFNHLKGPLMEERYAHQRLQYIFPRVELPFFTISDDSCVFIFDNGPSIYPELSGKVLGKLYYDKSNQRLCLGIWPQPNPDKLQRFPCQTTILLDGIDECKFKFYHPPDPFKKPVDPQEVGRSRPEDGWQEDWKADYGAIPALVKIKISRKRSSKIKNHQFEYYFELPVTVIYPKEQTV